jgi:hypothetical protein
LLERIAKVLDAVQATRRTACEIRPRHGIK